MKPRALLLVVGSLGAAALAAAVAGSIAYLSNRRAEVRRFASGFLACPPDRVEITSQRGGDTWEDYEVSGCGKAGLVTCLTTDECAFHAPKPGGGYEEAGRTRPP